MKNIAFLAIVGASLAACSSVQTPQNQPSNIASANPASQYCIDQGGKLEIVKEANGEVGYCQLKNGQKIEEWTLFRQNQSQCNAEEAAKLVGQSNLSDAQIKQVSKASIIRRVEPGQPVTMDYRVERITITIDPATQKISQVSCG